MNVIIGDIKITCQKAVLATNEYFQCLIQSNIKEGNENESGIKERSKGTGASGSFKVKEKAKAAGCHMIRLSGLMLQNEKKSNNISKCWLSKGGQVAQKMLLR